MTIGLEGVPNALAGEANVSTVQSTDNPWFTNFDPGGGLPGGNIAIDDGIGGAWYALNGDANGVAGDDLKVLVGQFTTTGELSVSSTFRSSLKETEATSSGTPSVSVVRMSWRDCTDETACNYDATATGADDDVPCTYPGSHQLSTVTATA